MIPEYVVIFVERWLHIDFPVHNVIRATTKMPVSAALAGAIHKSLSRFKVDGNFMEIFFGLEPPPRPPSLRKARDSAVALAKRRRLKRQWSEYHREWRRRWRTLREDVLVAIGLLKRYPSTTYLGECYTDFSSLDESETTSYNNPHAGHSDDSSDAASDEGDSKSRATDADYEGAETGDTGEEAVDPSHQTAADDSHSNCEDRPIELQRAACRFPPRRRKRADSHRGSIDGQHRKKKGIPTSPLSPRGGQYIPLSERERKHRRQTGLESGSEGQL